jgi:hypothetical protein
MGPQLSLDRFEQRLDQLTTGTAVAVYLAFSDGATYTGSRLYRHFYFGFKELGPCGLRFRAYIERSSGLRW